MPPPAWPQVPSPRQKVLLLAAVDVQDTWLEMSVWGFGRGEESWLIWHQKIEGNPAEDDVWQQVDTIRQTNWPRADGGTLRIAARDSLREQPVEWHIGWEVGGGRSRVRIPLIACPALQFF